jgi:hypothetical protein
LCADKIDKFLKKISESLFIVAVITDGIRILAAICEDLSNNNKEDFPNCTIKTIASIAGGWNGAALGASSGALMGEKVGT